MDSAVAENARQVNYGAYKSPQNGQNTGYTEISFLMFVIPTMRISWKESFI